MYVRARVRLAWAEAPPSPPAPIRAGLCVATTQAHLHSALPLLARPPPTPPRPTVHPLSPPHGPEPPTPPFPLAPPTCSSTPPVRRQPPAHPSNSSRPHPSGAHLAARQAVLALAVPPHGEHRALMPLEHADLLAGQAPTGVRLVLVRWEAGPILHGPNAAPWGSTTAPKGWLPMLEVARARPSARSGHHPIAVRRGWAARRAAIGGRSARRGGHPPVLFPIVPIPICATGQFDRASGAVTISRLRGRPRASPQPAAAASPLTAFTSDAN